MKTKITELNCKRCGHKWNPRQTEIRLCPSCKSPYWDKERKFKTKLPELNASKLSEIKDLVNKVK